MPRGGNNGGWKNSPINGDAKDLFVDDEDKQTEVTKSITNSLRYFGCKMVKNQPEAEERTLKYFKDCIEDSVRPTIEGWAMCLGTTRASLWDWEVGRRHGPVDADFVKKGKEIMAKFDADMVNNGKLNPVTYIFRSKNYYGLKDSAEITVNPGIEKVEVGELLAAAEELPDD